MSEICVQAFGVEKTYQLGTQQLKALKAVSLKLKRHEFVALAGSSGSGKSTLLNLIGGLDHPTQGEMEVLGQKLRNLDDVALADFRRKNLGFVFQTFNLLPVLTAVENVEYPMLRRTAISPQERRQKAEKILERVGLKDQMHRKPSEMSGGQRQRVAVARALVHEPELVIADEPTANLDRKNAREIVELLGELNRSGRSTIVFSSHDPEILKFAQRVIAMSDGEIVP